MPSLQPHGAKLASLRRALGLTQLELAIRSGVSERTVRNAERGRLVKRSFLEFIAGGLGVTLSEVVVPCGELDQLLRWQRHVGRLLSGLQRVVDEHDSSDLLDLAHPGITMQVETHMPFFSAGDILRGDYSGIDGVKRFIDNGFRYWEVCGEGGAYVERPMGAGDMVLIRCGQQVLLDDDRQAWLRCLYVCEFEQERILRFEEFLAPGCGIPATANLALQHAVAD